MTKKKKLILTIVGISLAVIAVTLTILFFGTVSVEVVDDTLCLDATFVSSLELKIADMQSVALVGDIDLGSMVSGINNVSVKAGVFNNTWYTDYIMYAHGTVKNYVVITMQDALVVVNCATTEETAELYTYLQAIVNP